MPSHLYRMLSQLNQEGLSALDEYEDLLDQEIALIKSRDAAHIEEVVERKIELMRQIELNFSSRTALLVEHGFDHSEDSLHTVIEAFSDTQKARFHDETQQLQDAIRSVQAKNAVNQTTLHRVKENAGRLLDLMKGKHPDNDMYNASGQRKNQQAQSHLGSA